MLKVLDEKQMLAREHRRAQYLKHRERRLADAALWAKNNPERKKASRRVHYERQHIIGDAYIREQKSKPCADCGLSYPYFVMDFDHVRGEKSNCVGAMRDLSIARIAEEIAKCDVVCSNCHRVRTFNRDTRWIAGKDNISYELVSVPKGE